MPIGPGVFGPQGQFYIIRSYLKFFDLRVDGVTVTGTGPSFTFPDGINPAATHHINIDFDFWPWSSNKRSLDHVMLDYYVDGGGLPGPVPAPYSLGYFVDPFNNAPTLVFLPYSIAFTTHHRFSFPTTSSPYWADGTEN